MRRRRFQPLAIVAVLAAIALFQLFNRQQTPEQQAPPTVQRGSRVPSPAPPAPVTPQTAGEATDHARLDGIAADERIQVEKTLQLIARGGPFLHRQDGSIFSNREGRLPVKPRGYYREYTVETPGGDTRGARRIVRGEEGETYYTNDHYRTFVRVE